jgi:hypothetical protein
LAKSCVELGKLALSPGFPEYFVYLVGSPGDDTGTRPSIQTNAIPASGRGEAHLLIAESSTRDEGVETQCLFFKFGISQDENNG